VGAKDFGAKDFMPANCTWVRIEKAGSSCFFQNEAAIVTGCYRKALSGSRTLLTNLFEFACSEGMPLFLFFTESAQEEVAFQNRNVRFVKLVALKTLLGWFHTVAWTDIDALHVIRRDRAVRPFTELWPKSVSLVLVLQGGDTLMSGFFFVRNRTITHTVLDTAWHRSLPPCFQWWPVDQSALENAVVEVVLKKKLAPRDGCPGPEGCPRFMEVLRSAGVDVSARDVGGSPVVALLSDVWLEISGETLSHFPIPSPNVTRPPSRPVLHTFCSQDPLESCLAAFRAFGDRFPVMIHFGNAGITSELAQRLVAHGGDFWPKGWSQSDVTFGVAWETLVKRTNERHARVHSK